MKLELIFQYMQRQLNQNYVTKYILRKIEWVSIYNKLFPYKYLPKETVARENSPPFCHGKTKELTVSE